MDICLQVTSTANTNFVVNNHFVVLYTYNSISKLYLDVALGGSYDMKWSSGTKMFYTNFDEFKASNTILLLSSGKWEMAYNSAYIVPVICEFTKGICIAHKYSFTKYLIIMYLVITSSCLLLGLVWLCNRGLTRCNTTWLSML